MRNIRFHAILLVILVLGTFIPGTFADGDPYLAGFLEGMSHGTTAADDYHLDEALVDTSQGYRDLMHAYPEGFPDGSREFVYFFIEDSNLETQSCHIGLRADASFISYSEGIDYAYEPSTIDFADVAVGEIYFFPSADQYVGVVSLDEETCTLAVRFRDSTIFEDLSGLIMIGDGEEDSSSEETVPSEEISCLDSDGGQDYGTQGTMLRDGEEFVDYCVGNDLVEYFCAGGFLDESGEEIHEYRRTCPEACVEGACVSFDELDAEEVETETDEALVASCIDEGDNEFILESVRVYDELGGVVEYFDGCSSDGVYVSQFYCQSEEFPSLAYDSVDSRQTLCELGCVEGVCVSEDVVVSSDLESSISDDSIDKTPLASKPRNSLFSRVASFFVRLFGRFDSSSDKTESFEEVGFVCEDTDGGENLFDQGVVSFSFGDESADAQDSCYSESQVLEHVCNQNPGSEGIASLLESCPEGFSCQEGACVSNYAEELGCRDFDGGENLLIASYVEADSGRNYDSCAAASQVTEWICNNSPGFEGEVVGLLEDCPVGTSCLNGACV